MANFRAKPHTIPIPVDQKPAESDTASKCPFLSLFGSSGSSTGAPPPSHQRVITAPKTKPLSSNEVLKHPLCPARDGEDEGEFKEGIRWRNGAKGDYTAANAKYLNERIATWQSPACLEHVVSNLVKTLEMELTKKANPAQWISVDPAIFRYRANGGAWVETQEAVEKGSYNILLKGADPEMYDAEQSFDESHQGFHAAFPGGFALEILKVYGAPPEVGFTWRHWGKFDGQYRGNQGDGRDINILGFGNAKVKMPDATNKRIRFTEVEVFYDMDSFLAELNGKSVNCVTDAVLGAKLNRL